MSITLDCTNGFNDTQTTTSLSYEFNIGGNVVAANWIGPEPWTECTATETVPAGYTQSTTCEDYNLQSTGEFTAAGSCTINNNPACGDSVKTVDEACDDAGGCCDQSTCTVRAEGYVCNPGSGDSCDPDEVCSGTPGEACPADYVEPAGTVCHPSISAECDPAEVCSGTAGDACPADLFTPDDTLCGDPTENFCTEADSCLSGICEQNNKPCGAFSSVTKGGLCEYDAEPDKGTCIDGDGNFTGACSLSNGDDDCPDESTCEPSNQFRLSFKRDLQLDFGYALNASFPGQFWYNGLVDTTDLEAGFMLVIHVPYPFGTQGANPFKVYDADALEELGEGCAEPGGEALMSAKTTLLLEDWLNGVSNDWLNCDTVVGPGGEGNCEISVEIPAEVVGQLSGPLLYFSLHMDYLRKDPDADANDDGSADRYDRGSKTSPWGSADALQDSATNDGPVDIQDCRQHVFSHEVYGVDYEYAELTSWTENLNKFKPGAGVHGRVYCSDNDSAIVPGWLELRRQDNNSLVRSTTEDADGFFDIGYKLKGKAKQYYIRWCGEVSCINPVHITEPFWLQANGTAEVDLVASDGCDDLHDAGGSDWETIEPHYPSGKYKN